MSLTWKIGGFNLIEALIEIILFQLKERYTTEKGFYERTLGITPQSWSRIKKGTRSLSFENFQRLSQLFTPYEWYLANEVARMQEILKMGDAVFEYQYLKRALAVDWGERALAGDLDYSVSYRWGSTVPLPRFRKEILMYAERRLPLSGYSDTVVLTLSDSEYQLVRENPQLLYDRWEEWLQDEGSMASDEE